MQKFARILTKEHGLRVIFRGSNAYTDGKLIVIPEVSVLDQPGLSDEEFKAAMDFLRCIKAWVYHEGGHVIFSNFRVVKMSHYKGGTQLNSVWNALEDCWMERKMAMRFPGARADLAFKNDWVEKKQVQEWSEKTEPLPDKFRQIVLLTMRLLKAGPTEFKNDYWKMFDREEREFVFKNQDLLFKVFKQRSSRGVYKLAKKWWKLIRKHLKQPEEMTPEEKEESKPPKLKAKVPKPTEPDEDGDDGSADADEDDVDPSKDDGEPEEDESDGDAGKPEAEEKSEDPDKDEDDLPNEEDDEPVEDEGEMLPSSGDPLLEQVKKHMQRTMERARGIGSEFGYLVYSTEGDEIGPLPIPSDAKEIGRRRALAGELKAKLGAMFGPLTRLVNNLLRARNRSFSVTGLSEGDVNPDDLHLLISGASFNIFKQQVDSSSTEDVCCLLTTDMSGSMGMGAKEMLARLLFVAFAHAMAAIRIKNAIHSWATGDDATPPSKRDPSVKRRRQGASELRWMECPPEDREIYSRWGNLIIRVIKDFEEDWEQVGKLRIGDYYAQGCNLDGESVLYGARCLLARPEKRKIMYVITDGLPNGEMHDDGQVQHDYLTEVIPRIRATGIEVVAFGIRSPVCRQYYEYEEGGNKKGFMDINDEKDVMSTVLTLLPQIMSRKRY